MNITFRAIASQAILTAPRLFGVLLTAALVRWTGGDGRAPRPQVAQVAAGDRAYGATLIRGLGANVSGLIPNSIGDKYSHDAVSLIYSGLITHDKDSNIVPDLTESWNLAPDCREVTFKLRKN